MKKYIIGGLAIFLLATSCGEQISTTNPNKEEHTSIPGQQELLTSTAPNNFDIISPKENTPISSPLVVEISLHKDTAITPPVSLSLRNSTGQNIAQGFLEASQGSNTLKGTLTFDTPSSGNGSLLFGSGEHTFELPILFSSKKETILYYPNSLKSGETCGKVYPLTRISNNLDTPSHIIEGLTEEIQGNEKAAGYYTSVLPNLKIKDLTLVGDTLHVQFLLEDIASLPQCAKENMEEQITSSLLELDGVKHVQITWMK